jgi:hypothetical protein
MQAVCVQLCVQLVWLLSVVFLTHVLAASSFLHATIYVNNILYAQGFAVSVTTDPEQIEYLESAATVMLPQG